MNSIPIRRVRSWRSRRAEAFGRKPSCPATASTWAREASLGPEAPRRMSETSWRETPARSATSRIVGIRAGLPPGSVMVRSPPSRHRQAKRCPAAATWRRASLIVAITDTVSGWSCTGDSSRPSASYEAKWVAW